ncbi:hypothetical protein HAX54_028593 [Datura stramonium]|uniref:PGG domain-containing protein n=1 Tax=Datura stramonium TaxID=4076 RepID=A0ABS8V5U9_DATST|nr:hypothetical protein [Datura stramonium]
MAMNIELSETTKDEEMQLAIKDDDLDDIHDSEVFETKTIGSVELTEPILDSSDEGCLAEDKSANWILEASSKGNFTRSSIGSTEVQTLLSLLLTVMVFIAGGAYAALLNFHEVFPQVKEHVKTVVNLSIFELLTFPSATVEGFLFLWAATVTFMTSMLVILFALCLISRKWAWGPSLATLSLFVIVAMFLNFLAMLNKLVPHFITVGGGHAKVPGALIVVFYSVYIMVLVPIFAFIAQRVIDGIYTCRTGKMGETEV